jgi:hypothetical protein
MVDEAHCHQPTVKRLVLESNPGQEVGRQAPDAAPDTSQASDQRMPPRVYGAAFLLRAARARGRNLRSPRITYST